MPRMVVVGSTGDAKVLPVKAVCSEFFGEDVEVIAFAAASDIPDQPLGREQTKTGAMNRATNARIEYPDAWITVGIESGIVFEDDAYTVINYIALDDGERCHITTAATFKIPDEWGNGVMNRGVELREYLISIDHKTNHKDGIVGWLSNGKYARSALYEGALRMAFAPILHHEDYYPEPEKNYA
jgi:inosine/xanthosine triphosphatase